MYFLSLKSIVSSWSLQPQCRPFYYPHQQNLFSIIFNLHFFLFSSIWFAHHKHCAQSHRIISLHITYLWCSFLVYYSLKCWTQLNVVPIYFDWYYWPVCFYNSNVIVLEQSSKFSIQIIKFKQNLWKVNINCSYHNSFTSLPIILPNTYRLIFCYHYLFIILSIILHNSYFDIN